MRISIILGKMWIAGIRSWWNPNIHDYKRSSSECVIVKLFNIQDNKRILKTETGKSVKSQACKLSPNSIKFILRNLQARKQQISSFFLNKDLTTKNIKKVIPQKERKKSSKQTKIWILLIQNWDNKDKSYYTGQPSNHKVEYDWKKRIERI